MRVPLEWLHEYCAPELSSSALAERLAMTGTEVERIAMLKHGIPDLRMLYNNDVRFLEQFG